MRAHKSIFIAALLILSLAYMVSAQTESECVQMCNSGDYKSASSCYKGFRSRADAYLATANCAFNNGNNQEAEKYALDSAKWRASWATFFLNKLPKVKIHTGGTASSYALAYAASGKEGHRDQALRYARTSGQCDGAEDVGKCAEYYVNSSVRNFERRVGITGRNTNPEMAERTCNGLFEFYSWLSGECKCRKGYEDLAGECALDVYDARLRTESSVELEEAFNNLEKMEAAAVSVVNLDNERFYIGVQRKADGTPAYTKDGKKWVSDIKSLTNPGIKDTLGKIGGFLSKLNPINWFDAKYKDDRPGQNKQVKFEIAKGVRKEFVESGSDPKVYEEQAWDYYQSAQGNIEFAQNLIRDMIDKGVLDASQEYTIDSIRGKFWDYFIAFPAESVKKIANEASDTDFFQGVYYYVREREAGRSPEYIRSNTPEEMEFSVGVATVESFGADTYWNKLEEAYHRYRVWEELQP